MLLQILDKLNVSNRKLEVVTEKCDDKVVTDRRVTEKCNEQ